MRTCLIKFRTKALQGGRPVKVLVEHEDKAPISRETAFHMILAASLLLEEAELVVLAGRTKPRLVRRMELLRERMEDAMERENTAKAVISSRPPIPTMEDSE